MNRGSSFRLRELEAEFVKSGEDWCFSKVERIENADGLLFLCPACFAANDGAIGTHSVLIPFANAPDNSYAIRNKQNVMPKWNATGSSLDNLQLHPSIQLLGGCNWHGWVGNAGIQPGYAG